MAADRPDDVDDSLLSVSIKRSDALKALEAAPMVRSELMESLDVSRTTSHRIVKSLEAHNLAVRTNGVYRLTGLGRAVAHEVERFRQTLRSSQRLEPLLNAAKKSGISVDPAIFADVTVTLPESADPYAPVGRFITLLRESDSLRGFDTTTIAPIYVDEIREEILGGMETDVIYLPETIESIFDSYPDACTTAIESGYLTLSTHDDLPFGLAIFDDRVGLGGYDESTGMLSIFADTDSPAAVKWADELLATYREDAERIDVDSIN